jgi:NAD(P)-dependent dehydrogenase (short-subunit alcohol dehydrogenase family)
MQDVSGKVAFVSGAASGIGLGIAKALARAGARVMLCDIEEAALARAVEALKPSNAEIAGVKADVSLKRELQAAADATIERFGAVNILVNNAGVGGGGPYGVWDDALWDWTLGVNLMSVISGVEIFGPLIEKAGAPGQIVSTASIAGLLSRTSMPYNVSKYGVVALSEGLRVDLAPRGIGVSVLCPGFIHTQINTSHRNLPERYGPRLKAAMEQVPPNEFIKMLQARIEDGLDPDYVGELVRARGSRATGRISSPTQSSSPTSRRGSRRSGRGSIEFVGERRRVDARCLPFRNARRGDGNCG